MDTITPQRRSENMRRITSKGTRPEMIVRRMVHAMGYRYRLHRKDLPGRPDLVFPSRRKVIFVHGCFWHQHPSPSCRIVRQPKSNQDYWLKKLQHNRDRDVSHQAELRDLGWEQFTVWECEVKGDTGELEHRLRDFLSQ